MIMKMYRLYFRIVVNKSCHISKKKISSQKWIIEIRTNYQWNVLSTIMKYL